LQSRPRLPVWLAARVRSQAGDRLRSDRERFSLSLRPGARLSTGHVLLHAELDVLSAVAILLFERLLRPSVSALRVLRSLRPLHLPGRQTSNRTCPTANRIGHCTESSPDGAFTQTLSYYAPTTVADAMTSCTGQAGTFAAN
jgi:hypothetical protein